MENERGSGWSAGKPSSADDLLRLLSALEPGWLFRGESKWFASRAPSLGRLPRRPPNLEAALEMECLLIQRFQSLSHAWLTSAELEIVDNVFGYLVLMQHHRAPTRLLDWSFSPWVAAYHAATCHPDQDGYVWGFSPSSFAKQVPIWWQATVDQVLRASHLEEYADALIATEPFVMSLGSVQSTPRMVAQQSIFTIGHPAWLNHTRVIAKYTNAEQRRVVVIPANLKCDLLRRLLLMNVTAASLYPGLDGVGMSLAENYHLGVGLPSSSFL